MALHSKQKPKRNLEHFNCWNTHFMHAPPPPPRRSTHVTATHAVKIERKKEKGKNYNDEEENTISRILKDTRVRNDREAFVILRVWRYWGSADSWPSLQCQALGNTTSNSGRNKVKNVNERPGPMRCPSTLVSFIFWYIRLWFSVLWCHPNYV